MTDTKQEVVKDIRTECPDRWGVDRVFNMVMAPDAWTEEAIVETVEKWMEVFRFGRALTAWAAFNIAKIVDQAKCHYGDAFVERLADTIGYTPRAVNRWRALAVLTVAEARQVIHQYGTQAALYSAAYEKTRSLGEPEHTEDVAQTLIDAVEVAKKRFQGEIERLQRFWGNRREALSEDQAIEIDGTIIDAEDDVRWAEDVITQGMQTVLNKRIDRAVDKAWSVDLGLKPGAMHMDGHWYVARWGCDTLARMVAILRGEQ